MSKQRKNHDVSRSTSAMLSFAPHHTGSPVKGSRQLRCRGVELKPINYQLSALRCGQRSLVGNGFIRSAVMVWSAPTGRATAKNVSAQCKCASEKPPLKKCVCLTANDLITPHPSQATPSPQATQGEGNDETSTACRCINCIRRCNKAERINPFPTRCRGRQKTGRSVTAPMNNE